MIKVKQLMIEKEKEILEKEKRILRRRWWQESEGEKKTRISIKFESSCGVGWLAAAAGLLKINTKYIRSSRRRNFFSRTQSCWIEVREGHGKEKEEETQKKWKPKKGPHRVLVGGDDKGDWRWKKSAMVMNSQDIYPKEREVS